MRKAIRPLIVALALLAMIGLWLVGVPRNGVAQNDMTGDLTIGYGDVVTSTVESRFGDEWVFSGCAGDVVTVTMMSDAYEPFLELYSPTGRDPLTATDEEGTLAAVVLPDNGPYTIVAAAKSIRDRGPYTLTLVAQDVALPAAAGEVSLWPSMTVTGVVADRIGDEWVFRGCAGDVIVIDMESQEFNTFLELYGPTGREPLAVDDDSGEDTNARISDYVLPQVGPYTVVAAGSSIRDRGGYSLTYMISTTMPLTRTGSLSPTTTTAPAVQTPVATAVGPVCDVLVATLNMRYGPGTVYVPTIGALPVGTQVRPLARNAAASWVVVAMPDTGEEGWISASPNFLDCTGDLSSLPLGVIPPTPTPLPTPTPTRTPVATPTPTQTPVPPQPQLPGVTGVVLQAPGGEPGDLIGEIYTGNGYNRGTADNPIFRDRMYLEAYVFDPREGNNVGDGISHVEFEFNCPNGGTYTTDEETPRFCSFGGNFPECNTFRVDRNSFFPDSDCAVEDGGFYSVQIRAFPSTSGRKARVWNMGFELDLQTETTGGGGRPDLVVNIVETGPGTTSNQISDALTFRVEAYDPSVGNRDGDGIDSVEMWVFGPNGREVRYRREGTAGYCIFQGGEPDCNVWVFADHNFEWPDGAAFEAGNHRLVAVAQADDGRTKQIEMNVDIR
ncbi:MAG: hypothetical protein H3C34_01560 [Caldilineaceae bacterium]|nr:hypothetical protein [Caldilineaceae bacterium]